MQSLPAASSSSVLKRGASPSSQLAHRLRVRKLPRGRLCPDRCASGWRSGGASRVLRAIAKVHPEMVASGCHIGDDGSQRVTPAIDSNRLKSGSLRVKTVHTRRTKISPRRNDSATPSGGWVCACQPPDRRNRNGGHWFVLGRHRDATAAANVFVNAGRGGANAEGLKQCTGTDCREVHRPFCRLSTIFFPALRGSARKEHPPNSRRVHAIDGCRQTNSASLQPCLDSEFLASIPKPHVVNTSTRTGSKEGRS